MKGEGVKKPATIRTTPIASVIALAKECDVSKEIIVFNSAKTLFLILRKFRNILSIIRLKFLKIKDFEEKYRRKSKN